MPPKIIEVPGQGQVEFPESMSDEQIVAAIKANSAPSESTLGQRAGRVAGLGARSLVRGATAIPTLMAEAVYQPVAAAGRAMGVPPIPGFELSPSAALEQTMTRAGLPQPESFGERLGTNIGTALTGAGTTQLALSAMKPISQAGEGIRQAFMQRPAMQGVSAGTGAASATTAGELGAGPLGQMAAGFAGSMVPFVPGMFRGSPTPEAARTSETLRKGQQLGLVVPPSQGGGGMGSQTMEGIAGKLTTAQRASGINEKRITDAVKTDLGIPKNEAITVERLAAIRKEAGTPYRQIEEVGQFATDKKFSDDITRLSGSQQTLAKEFPELADEKILKLTQSMNRPSFSGRTLITLIDDLRGKATTAYRAGDAGVGRFYKGAAEAVEDMIDRNLQAGGNSDLLQRFRDARETIAKAHTAEAALNDTTATIVPKLLGSQVDAGKPLSGNMQTAGRFALAFPKATQETSMIGSQPGISPLDFYTALGLSGGGAAYTGSAAGMAAGALPLVRPALRGMLLSKPYQSTFVNPETMSAADSAGLGLLGGVYARPR